MSNKEGCYQVEWADPRAATLLDHDLERGRPDIMKISWKDERGNPHGSHFVLIGGYSWEPGYESYRAYDPNQHYNQFAAYPPGLKKLYSAPKTPKSYTPLRIDRYKGDYLFYPAIPDQSRFFIWRFSPVELQLISPDGNVTGYDPATGGEVADIPRAYYTEESESSINADDSGTESAKVLSVNKPAAGNYILKIFGTGDGPYTIKMEGVTKDGTVNLDTSFSGTASVGMSETYKIKYSPTGEATLTQTNELPVANAGTDQAGEQGYEITLDGSGSNDPDGDPLKHAWSFVSRPEGSVATLSDASSAKPMFIPDKAGTYILQLVVNDYFADTGSVPATVTITALPIKSRISVTPNFTTPLSSGPSAIFFDVNNTGRIGVSSGIIDITLKDPDGNLVYNGSKVFGIAVGESRTVDVPVTIPSLKFGNYTLTYTQSDETRAGSPTTIAILNSASATFSFDNLAYKVRETANVAVNLTNTGKFNLNNVSVTVSMPDAGFTDAKTVNIGQGQALPLQYQILIPTTITPGQHDVIATLTLPSGSSYSQSANLTVPQSGLRIGHSGPTNLVAGGLINLTIENSGGVDTSYTTESLNITDGKGVVIYQGSITGSVLSGEKKTLADIIVPLQAATGPEYLYAKLKDARTGETTSLKVFLDITGLEAGLSARTDKDLYLNTEAITALSALTTGALGIDNGTLDIKVKRNTGVKGDRFTHFLPKNWWPFYRPSEVAVSPDNSVYVVDTDNNRIVKFGSNGNFVIAWGEDGWGDGQLNDPYGIAVSHDGFVYVADTWNHRIQKFDSNGNFIAKWGSSGNGDGQLYAPHKIAVDIDGYVYVSDSYNHRIQKFDSNGNFITKWGSYGNGDGQFLWPWGIGVSSDGFVYVIDGGGTSKWDINHHRVMKFDTNGNFISKWGTRGTGDGQFNVPWGLSIGPDGSVYVADSDNNRVQRFDSNGTFIGKWGSYGNGNGQFDWFTGISVGPDGSVYVADSDNNRIQKFDGNGGFINKWGQEFDAPSGIAIHSDGSIYVADTMNDRIVKYDNNGNIIATIGKQGNADGQFLRPEGVAVSHDEFIYVTDTYNHRIHKFDSNGNFITKWGSTSSGWGSPGSGDGQFNYPSGIAVAPDGSVYVADIGNHRIQKFDGNGNFIAKWGSYGSGDSQFIYPNSLAVGSDGSVYVADMWNHRVQKFNDNGNFITKLGSYGWGDGQLYYPQGITVSPNGSVYVSSDNRIQRFDSNGNFIAKWEGYGSSDGQFSYPTGIAVDSNGVVYVADTGNDRIQKLQNIVVSGISEILFETTIPINQPTYAANNYTTNVGVLNVAGKLYLETTLKNNVGQTIATSEYPFYVFDGNTILQFSTDKKVYKPGETITITGEVKNLAEIAASSLSLNLSLNDHGIYASTFDLAASGIYQFTTTTVAGTEGAVALIGTVSQNDLPLVEIVDGYEVATPKVAVSVSGPDVVGKDPFDLYVEVKNTGKADFTGRLLLMRDWWNTIDDQQITIPAGESRLLQYSQQIAQTTSYTIDISGDVAQTSEKTVIFGEAATISFGNQKTEKTCSEPVYEPICGNRERECTEKDLIYVVVKEQVCQEVNSPSVYPEGKVGIPVTITNNGQIDSQVEVNFQLSGQGSVASGQIKIYYLPKGESVTDTLYYDLASGSYQLTAVSSQPYAFAQTSFTVLKENDLTMTNSVGSQGTDGLIPVTVNLANNGYNEINGSINLTVMNNEGKAVWRGEAQVSGLKPQISKGYTINVASSGIISGAYKTDIVLYSTSGKQLAVNQAQVRVLGPIFEITSIPAYSTFTVGRQAAFSFSIKNTGTAAGTTNFSVKAMDVMNQSVTEALNPGEEKSHTFNLTVPEDAEEKDYNAEYTLTPTLSQGEKGQAKFRIAGVNVGATATLDKTAYKNGDTALLTLTVSKQSQFDDGTYMAIIRYGAYHDMKTFTLTSQPLTLTFSVPLAEITGENLFYSIHFESGRTIYMNSLSLNRAQPDLVVSSIAPGAGTMRTQKIEVGVTNVGDLPSEATTLKLYDGEPYSGGISIATLAVSALTKDESATITYDWGILGKAGKRTVYAVVDPDNTVVERMEANNTSSVDITVPDITMDVSTTKTQYEANEDVGIAETVVNLTPGATYTDAILTTTVKDPAGSIVTTLNDNIPALAPGEASYANSWNTASSRPGRYTINAVVSGQGSVVSETPLATASTAFEMLPTVSAFGDMTSPGEVIQGFPLDISYSITNNGNIDIPQAEVKVEVEDKARGGKTTLAEVALDYLAVLSTNTASIAVEKVDVEPGEYTISLILTAGDKTITISSKDITVKPPLKVTKGISTMPRVLVWTQSGDSPDSTALQAGKSGTVPSTNEKIATDALAKLGAYYKAVHTEAEFIEGMRSGYFNTYALLNTNRPTTDGLTSELRERVYGGDTLILTGNSNMDDIKVSEVTGTKFTGYMADGIRTTTAGFPFYEQSMNITTAGKIQKVTVTSDKTLIWGTVQDYPSIVVNSYGKGKGVLITFDLGISAEAVVDTSTYSALLGRVIWNATPLEVKLTPEGVVPVEISIQSLGSAFDLKIVEKAGSRLTLLDTTLNGVTDRVNNTVTWDAHLSGDQTMRPLYLTALPQYKSSYNTETAVYYLNKGEYKLYNTYPLNFELPEGTSEIQNNILNAINFLTVTKDQQGIKDSIVKSYLALISRSSWTRKDIDKDIHDLLKITEDIKKLSPDTTEVRAGLNKLLIVFQRRWVIAR